MRRATLRMTLESSTTRQVFIARKLPTMDGCPCTRTDQTDRSRGQGVAAGLEDAVDVEDHHQLAFEAMHAARDAGEMLVEIHRVGLARTVGELEHLADAIDQEPVGFAAQLDADGHRRLSVGARRQTQ